ncbi:hypothetical protein SDC9_102559 [bioreactor metagenome]|uniref:Uncharacterized protein n=1 Tax=bioreactor metagenome TaxID=1076179 RepID=A0A645AR73_9ZZZZ
MTDKVGQRNGLHGVCQAKNNGKSHRNTRTAACNKQQDLRRDENRAHVYGADAHTCFVENRAKEHLANHEHRHRE